MTLVKIKLYFSVNLLVTRVCECSSSPDSLSERSGGEARGATAAPGSLHKLAVPLARCEVPEVRDAAVAAIGNINPDALK